MLRSYADSERRPVYDLTVADAHEFTAAGVIVHNCVWALTPFLNASFLPPGPVGKREWAGSREYADLQAGEEARAHRRMREIAQKATQGLDTAPWDLDGFAPSDDEALRATPRNNVRAWR